MTPRLLKTAFDAMQYRRFAAIIVISNSWCIPFSFATQQDGLLHRWGSFWQHADLVWSPCSRCKSGSAHKRNSPSKALALLTVSLLRVISSFSMLFSTHFIPVPLLWASTDQWQAILGPLGQCVEVVVCARRTTVCLMRRGLGEVGLH